MRTLLLLATVVAVGFCAQPDGGDGKFFVCYWGSWSHYRQEHGQFRVGNIDPLMCTHLIYGFAKLANGEIAAYDPYLDLKTNWGLGMYEKFNELRQKNPNLKTLLAIGGWNEGSVKYSQMASTAAGRTKFVQSAVRFIEEHGFQGLDFDWEYPGTRGGQPQDKQNFVLLLKELRQEFDKKNLLLTAAVSAGKGTIDAAYDIPNVAKYLHFINVMCYDYFGAWDKTTGHNAPLRSRQGGSELEQIFNIEFSIDYWIKNGAPARKLILGMPLYGRTFTLSSSSDTSIGASVNGPGPAGPITREGGYLGYIEMCDKFRSGGYKFFTDPNVAAPVAVKGTEWIGYDDIESLAVKVRFAQSKGLGGAMVWSIETDDFNGRCHGTKNPLMSSIRSTLNGGVVPTFPPTRPTPSTPSKATPSVPTQRPPTPSTSRPDVSTGHPPEFKCTQDGFFPHPTDNNKFIGCSMNANGELEAVIFKCPDGTVFDPIYKVCRFP